MVLTPVTLTVKSITSSSYDGVDGQRVYDAVHPHLVAECPVTLSFAGVRGATTSFVNEALIRLLDSLSYDDIRRLLRIIDVTGPIARLIRDRFDSEVARRAVL